MHYRSGTMSAAPITKVVGRSRIPASPEEAFRRARILQEQAELMNPYPRLRNFVFKAKTREDYERWRRNHPNPRLW